MLILAFILLAPIDDEKAPTGFTIKGVPAQEAVNFKVYTKAVCDEKPSHIFCHDEMYVKCNNKENIVDSTNLENFTGCGNIKLNLSDERANGSVIFKKEWEDPRK